MNVSTMRSIDRFVGIPLCWTFRLKGWLSNAAASQSTSDVRRILAIKFFGMGSIILTTPALSILKDAYPQARLGYLSFEHNRELLDRIPLVDDVVTIRTDSILTFAVDTLRTILYLRRVRYDAVFDFEFFSKFSTWLCRLTNAPIRAGFELPARWRTTLLTHSIPLRKDVHVTAAFCEQVSVMCNSASVPGLVAPTVRKEDSESLARKWHSGLRKYIVINVNSGETFYERRWMPEKFAKLVGALAGDESYDFSFIGLQRERAYVQSVIDATGLPERCRNHAGLLTFGELASLLRSAEALISNDSGPLHLAAALGTPTVGLFGPESPAFYGPQSEASTVVYKGISCSPCMNVYAAKSFRCPYNALCMHEIQVTDVLAAVEAIRAEA